MKKKLQLKAVQLKAETIRVLSSALLDRVAGGQTSYPPICGWPDPPVVVETEPWTFCTLCEPYTHVTCQAC